MQNRELLTYNLRQVTREYFKLLWYSLVGNQQKRELHASLLAIGVEPLMSNKDRVQIADYIRRSAEDDVRTHGHTIIHQPERSLWTALTGWRGL